MVDIVTTWFEGFVLQKICQKCNTREAKYMFIGMPRSEPEVIVFVCEECFKTLDDSFKLPDITIVGLGTDVIRDIKKFESL